MRPYFVILLWVLAIASCKKEAGAIKTENTVVAQPSHVGYPGYPIDSLVGTYHITGANSGWYMNIVHDSNFTVTYSVPIDTIITITKDTPYDLILSLYNITCFYLQTAGPDSVHNYYFTTDVSSPNPGNLLTFRKPYNDSVLFFTSHSSWENNNTTQWRGVKIH